jgi:hypothetical protein
MEGRREADVDCRGDDEDICAGELEKRGEPDGWGDTCTTVEEGDGDGVAELKDGGDGVAELKSGMGLEGEGCTEGERDGDTSKELVGR